MLATKCPGCGAAVPLSLAVPDALRCVFCGYQGRTTEAVSSVLRAAAEVVAHHHASERQLHGSLRLVVVYSRLLKSLLGGFVVLVLGTMLLMMLVWLLAWTRSETGDPHGAFMVIAVTPMLLIVAAVATLALWWLRRAIRRVETAIAAVPPEREGEPFRCHVCGATLDFAGVRGLARCGYCNADNVLVAGAVSDASRVRIHDLEDYAADVVIESGAVSRAFGKGAGLLLAAVVLTPFLCGIPTFVASVFVWGSAKVVEIAGVQRAPPTPGNRYGVVQTSVEGPCLAWRNLYTGRWERAGGPEDKDAQPVPDDAVREIALADLVGKRVRIAEPGNKRLGFSGLTRDPRASIYVGPGTARDFKLHRGPDTLLVYAEGNPYDRERVEVWGLCLEPDENR